MEIFILKNINDKNCIEIYKHFTAYCVMQQEMILNIKVSQRHKIWLLYKYRSSCVEEDAAQTPDVLTIWLT